MISSGGASGSSTSPSSEPQPPPPKEDAPSSPPPLPPRRPKEESSGRDLRPPPPHRDLQPPPPAPPTGLVAHLSTSEAVESGEVCLSDAADRAASRGLLGLTRALHLGHISAISRLSRAPSRRLALDRRGRARRRGERLCEERAHAASLGLVAAAAFEEGTQRPRARTRRHVVEVAAAPVVCSARAHPVRALDANLDVGGRDVLAPEVGRAVDVGLEQLVPVHSCTCEEAAREGQRRSGAARTCSTRCARDPSRQSPPSEPPR